MKELQLFTFILNEQITSDAPVSSTLLMGQLGIPRGTFYRMMKVLLDMKLVFRLKRGQYCVNGYWISSALNDINRMYDTKKWTVILS